MEGFTPFVMILVALLVATVSSTKLNVPRLRLSYKALQSSSAIDIIQDFLQFSSMFSGEKSPSEFTGFLLASLEIHW